MRTIRSLVGGSPVEGSPGGVTTISNPARLDDTLGEAALGDAHTLLDGCRVAREAQPGWAATPAPVRGRTVQQFGRLVEENAESLARLITREIGKPLRESRGEVQEVVDTCNFFLSEGRRLYGQTVPSEMVDKQLFTFRTPVGVAAIVTAGNFPWPCRAGTSCRRSSQERRGVEAGRVHTGHRRSFSQLLLHAGLPPGVFSMVLADGPSTFTGLDQALEGDLVDKIGFTGSTEVGRRIGELAGRHLKTPCLELGGKNPLVVMPDADLDLAVEGALFSGFGTAGQRCTSLGTAIVHADVHDDFLDRFSKAVSQAPIGDPTEDVLYGPMISSRFCDRFETWLELVRPHHATLGSTGIGRITAANPREGVRRRPEGRALRPPDDRRRRQARRRPRRHRDVRAARGRVDVRDVRRGHRPRERPRLRAVQRIYTDPTQRVPVPRTGLRRHGEREQLDVGRRGASPLRRQRPQR